MPTFASLFSGGGGADLGAIAAGCTHLWGLEHDPRIAKVYRENIGECHCLDILEADPHDFADPDWLHASPVCKAFSAANANKGEKQWDIDCGEKVSDFIRVLQPQYFSLENVRAYIYAKAYKIIIQALHDCGYQIDAKVVNAADYGVPQSRKRLIVVAYRGDLRWGFTPFTGNCRHVGWYEAIADLVHDLPDSRLADWQIKALPDEIKEHLLIDSSTGLKRRLEGRKYIWGKGETSFTLRASNAKRSSCVILIENTGARSDRPLQTRKATEPSWTTRAMGHDGHWHRSTALENGRVVHLDIGCLSRIQSFPDSYKFPEQKSLAGTIIGNSVPPLLMQKIIEATL